MNDKLEDEGYKGTVTVELPEGLTPDIAARIATAVKENYYHNAGRMIGEKVTEKLHEDGFADRVADAVVARMKLDEDEYTDGITAAMKENLLNTITTITTATLEAIQKKVESYGFIKIGNKW